MASTKKLCRVTAAIPKELRARMDGIRSHHALSSDDPDTGPPISACIRQALEDWCDKRERELAKLLSQES